MLKKVYQLFSHDRINKGGVDMEFWLHPFGIITIIIIILTVVLIVRIIIFCVMHWRGVLILAGIIGIPILLYNYLDDILLFLKGNLGQRILWIAILAGIGFIAFKVAQKVKEKILLDQIMERSLTKHHEKMDRLGMEGGLPEGLRPQVSHFELDKSGKYIIQNGKVIRNKIM